MSGSVTIRSDTPRENGLVDVHVQVSEGQVQDGCGGILTRNIPQVFDGAYRRELPPSQRGS